MQRQLDPERAIVALATRQAGRISRQQLLQLGLGAGAIDRRLRTGRLHLLHRGVYALGHPVSTREGRWWAAILACGDGAVLSHASAAAAWDLRRESSTTAEVTTSQRAGRTSRPGIRLHRVRALPPHQRTSLDALPLTTPARTVLDLVPRLTDRRVEQLLDQGELLRLLDLRDLHRTVTEHHGGAGAVRLAAILAGYSHTVTRSELEDLFLALCDAHAIPRPKTNVVLFGHEVDAHWPGTTLIVELDGYAHHRSPTAFEADRARDVAFALAGYRVLRFTYRQVVDRPSHTAAALLSALSQPSFTAG